MSLTDDIIKQFNRELTFQMKKKAPVRTGRLRDSIQPIAETVPGVEMVGYGEYVKQKGTHNREYNPFKQEAFDAAVESQALDKAVIQALNKAMDNTFK
jgi:hypothetical protein